MERALVGLQRSFAKDPKLDELVMARMKTLS